MKESEESASELFEAHSDSAMIFDLHQKAFNKMPFLVVTKIGVSSCHICAPLDYLCRNHIIHDMRDSCKIIFDSFQTIELRNALWSKVLILLGYPYIPLFYFMKYCVAIAAAAFAPFFL